MFAFTTARGQMSKYVQHTPGMLGVLLMSYLCYLEKLFPEFQQQLQHTCSTCKEIE